MGQPHWKIGFQLEDDLGGSRHDYYTCTSSQQQSSSVLTFLTK